MSNHPNLLDNTSPPPSKNQNQQEVLLTLRIDNKRIWN
jgi:hypothetical protein